MRREPELHVRGLPPLLHRTTVLHETRNMAFTDNNVIRTGLRELQRRLPPGWSLGEAVFGKGPVDARARLRAPDRRTGSLAIEAKERLDPKGVPAVVEQARDRKSTRLNSS